MSMSTNALRKSVTVAMFAASVIVGLAAPALAAPGDRLWLRRYNGSGNGSDRALAVAASADGTKVFVTGYSAGNGTGFDYVTVAYSAQSGSSLWTRRYDGPTSSDDVARAIAVSPDGRRVFVTGYSGGNGTGPDYATVAYDAQSGASVWTRRYNGPASSTDVGTAIVVSADGTTVFVTGYSTSKTTYTDYATVAYDAQSGASVWTRRYDGPGHSHDTAAAIAVRPDGTQVFVTGYSWGGAATGHDYATVAYDAVSGASVWTRRYNGPFDGQDVATAIAVSPDNTMVFVTGESVGNGTHADYATLAYNAQSGASVWTRRYNGPGGGNDHANAMQVSPNSSTVFVTGYSYGSSSTSNDYATVAYDAHSGASVWTRRYNGPGSSGDWANAIGVSPDGTKVFVTGESTGTATSSDFATVAYDAQTGGSLWTRRYDGPLHSVDGPLAMTVSPDGSRVFIAGVVDVQQGASEDYLTIAYSVH